MAIKQQTNNSLSQVDSLAAFLSEWAEGCPNHTTPQHRPFSLQPPTALPSGLLRRRNGGYGNISNDGSSLLHQLQEHEEVEEPNLSRSPEDGITLESSPCGVITSSAQRVGSHGDGAGTGGGNGGVPPPPLAVTRIAVTRSEQPAQQLPSNTLSSRLARFH